MREQGRDPRQAWPDYQAHWDEVHKPRHYAGQVGSEATPQEFLAALWECTAEWVRVLKPEGSIFVNLGDKYNSAATNDRSYYDNRVSAKWREPNVTNPKTKPVEGFRQKSLLGLPWRYALGCIDQLGLILRAEIIWAKPNGLPESVTDRVRRSHEQVFHFTRSPRYYAAVDEIREPHLHPNHHQLGSDTRGAKWTGSGEINRWHSETKLVSPLGKLPGSVWNIPAGESAVRVILRAMAAGELTMDDAERLICDDPEPGPDDVWSIPSQPLQVPARLNVDHFAAYPAELPRRIIAGWSPPGVCTACGQGRRPVTDRAIGSYESNVNRTRGHRLTMGAGPDHDACLSRANGVPKDISTTITGYACACTPYTDHPGTGHGVPYSESIAAGEYPNTALGLGHAGLAARPRTGPWREYHFDRWTPPPTRPAIVADPFGGTGTTALVASVLGRTGISFDLSHDYSRLARWRTADPGERCRVIGAPKPPPVADGQDALFGIPEITAG